MSDLVTTPFNKLYLPGADGNYQKLAISNVVPGTATLITTYNNHGLYGTENINIYGNGTNPFFNFYDFVPKIIDGKSFTIPFDTTSYIALCSDGYVIKRSSIVGPPRYNQDYNNVSLPVTLPTETYVQVEQTKNRLGLQSEVDLSLLGIPREEVQQTMMEDVTRYGLDDNIWKYSSDYTFAYPGQEDNTWWLNSYYANTLDYFDMFQVYEGTGVRFVPNESSIQLYCSRPPLSKPEIYPYRSNFPGLLYAGENYAYLETQRPFKYLPGRVNSFTFGIKATVDNLSSIPDDVYQAGYAAHNDINQLVFPITPSGNIVRWGVGNATDAYYFELSGNGQAACNGGNSETVFSVNRRRYFRGNSNNSSKPWYNIAPGSYTDIYGQGYQGTGQGIGNTLGQYRDDPFYCVDLGNTFPDPYAQRLELTRVFQKDFSQDTVDGNGPTKAKIDLSKVTMFKIDFCWYGAVGARFYVYLPVGNQKAQWILLHEIIGSDVFDAPVLQNPITYIKYMAKARAGGIAKISKYGVSSYIEGGQTGTTTQKTFTLPGDKIITNSPRPLIGISTGQVVPNSFNELIPNQKIVYPQKLSVTSTENCIIDMVWKPTRSLLHGVTRGQLLTGINTPPPAVSAVILSGTNLRAISGEFANFVKDGDPNNVVNLIGARIYESINNNFTQKLFEDPLWRTNSSILGTYVSAVSTNRTKNDVLWLSRSLSGAPVAHINYVVPNNYTKLISNQDARVFKPMEFKFEQLDRQAVSNEIFSGSTEYYFDVTKDLAYNYRNAGDYTHIPSASASGDFLFGAYFLKNYVVSLSSDYDQYNGSVRPDQRTKEVLISTSLPHLLSAGDTCLYSINSLNDPNVLLGNFILSGGTLPFRVKSTPSLTSAIVDVSQYLISNHTLHNTIAYTSQIGVREETPYITLTAIPQIIPTSNIYYFNYPYNVGDSRLERSPMPTYGLPADRLCLIGFGASNPGIIPADIGYVVQNPYILGYTPVTATNTYYTGGGGYFKDFIGNPGALNRFTLPKDRVASDPFKIVFQSSNIVNGICDAMIVTNPGDVIKQTNQFITWQPLSSIRFGNKNQIGKCSLSAFYPTNYFSGDAPPNFLEIYPGTGAVIDAQSTSPLYGAKEYQYADKVLGYNTTTVPRTITSLYVGKNQTQIFDISQYFGQTKEFLTNSGADFSSTPWNAIYFTGRTSLSGVVGTANIGITWQEQ